VTALETLANALRFAGLLVIIAGLWFSAGGMRVVVSGRMDERRKSANSLRFGLPLLVTGVLVLVAGTLLARLA
jgi:O-antigen/teichoic acid export membrane protein